MNTKKVFIYTLTNPLNGNIFYVGYSNNPKRRLTEHIRYKYNKNKDLIIEDILLNELKPIVTIIDECDYFFNDNEKMFKHELMEIYYIKKYRDDGVNITNLTDGGGCVNINNIPVFQYSESGVFVKKYDSLSEAANAIMVSVTKISQALNQRINKSSGGFYWFTDIVDINIIKFRRAAKRNIPILQYSLEGDYLNKFKSQSDAEKYTGINSKLINKCLRSDKYHQAGGYMWYYENNKPIKTIIYNGRYISKSIQKFNKNGEFLEEYDSINNAAIKNKINSTNISHNLIGNTKTAGGYVWKYGH